MGMKVFLSSTCKDLKDHRRATIDALDSLGLHVVCMERWSADPREPKEASLDRVEECELFVGLYAHRYGCIPEGADQSITEQEYRHAKELGNQCFCFLLDEHYPWPPPLVEREPGKEKLAKLKEKLSAEVVYKTFTTPETLRAAVATAVGRWLVEHPERGPEDSVPAEGTALPAKRKSPKVFISYKWQDDARDAWVDRLYTDLRKKYSVDAQLDKYEVDFGESFGDYMTGRIDRECDAMLFVITPAAVEAVDQSQSGGVHFEMQIANARRIREPGFRIIGIYREGDENTRYLRDHRYIDFRDDNRYERNLKSLADSLWERRSKPTLGQYEEEGGAKESSEYRKTSGEDSSKDSGAWRIATQVASSLGQTPEFERATAESRQMEEGMLRDKVEKRQPDVGWEETGEVLQQIRERALEEGIELETGHDSLDRGVIALLHEQDELPPELRQEIDELGRGYGVKIQYQDREAEKGGTSKSIAVELPGGAVMEMVWISPGTFMMGTTEEQKEMLRRQDIWDDFFGNEQPAHEATITRGFWLGRYELTQMQWKSVMDTSPWEGLLSELTNNLSFPATHVSWKDVQTFIGLLNEHGSGGFRLPTEAEWEYACRAKTQTLWSFGDDKSELEDHAWYHGNAWNPGERYVREVGQKLPNPWGLYDMYGNVGEWVQDRYGPYTGDEMDPTGPRTGPGHVIRGGAANTTAEKTRSAMRASAVRGFSESCTGGRLVRQKPE